MFIPWHCRFELRFDPKFGKDPEEITGRIYVEVLSQSKDLDVKTDSLNRRVPRRVPLHL